MAAGRTEAPRAADDVQTGLCGAHPAAASLASVSDGLTIVIVCLFAKAKVRAGNVNVCDRGEVVNSAASGRGEGKVFNDNWQRRWAIAPVWVVDRSKGIMVVAAPFGLAEAGVGPEEAWMSESLEAREARSAM